MLALKLAFRYLLSTKKASFINILSLISMVALGVGTAALVIVLSAFNGMTDVIRGMFNTLDPDLKIVKTEAKFFQIPKKDLSKIASLHQGMEITEVIEDNALASYQEAQFVVRIKGVSDNYLNQKRIKKSVFVGESTLGSMNFPQALVGTGVYSFFQLNLHDPYAAIQLSYPKNQLFKNVSPSNAFNKMGIAVSGVFSIEKEFDRNSVIVPIAFAAELLEKDSLRTAYELRLNASNREIAFLQKEISSVLGKDYQVLNADEQHADLLRLLQVEKLFVLLALSIILLIASFNIFVSLNMLVIDKQLDISLLKAIGANESFIAKTIVYIAGILSIIGSGIGLLLGAGIVLIQKNFQLVNMSADAISSLPYPVKMMALDFLIIACLLIFITLIASIGPANKAAKMILKKLS